MGQLMQIVGGMAAAFEEWRGARQKKTLAVETLMNLKFGEEEEG